MSIKKSVLSTVLLSTIVASTASFADPNWNNGPQGQYQQGQDARQQQQEYRHDVREQQQADRHDEREQQKFDRHEAHEQQQFDRHETHEREKFDHRQERAYDRDFRPHEHWHRGDRLPEAYRGHAVYVSDWQARHLYAPPVGHRWVEVNGDYVLVAIATNVIANILLAH